MWGRSIRNEEVHNTYKILTSKPAVKISLRVYSDNLYGKTMLKLDTGFAESLLANCQQNLYDIHLLLCIQY